MKIAQGLLMVKRRLKSRRSRIVGIILAAILFAGLAYCRPISVYRAAPIEGRVVDATTKAPIEGVIVVVVWETQAGFRGIDRDYLHLAESVTDAQGRYAFPAWGPKLLTKGQLNPFAPWLVLYKPGYQYLGLTNDIVPPYIDMPDPLRSEWNRQTVELIPFTDTPVEYAREAYGFTSVFFYDAPCSWTRTPRYTAALIELSREMRKQNLPELMSFEGLETEGGSRGPQCPDPRKVLKEYLHE